MNSTTQMEERTMNIPKDIFFVRFNEKLVIIINQMEFDNLLPRPGSDADVLNLKNQLKKLKCNYVVFDNLTRENILNTVPEFVKTKLQEIHEMDGLIFFILTHGGAGDQLCGSDQTFNLYEFANKFNDTALPMMANKPKLFFISACRGTDFQTTHPVNKYSGQVQVDSITIPHQPDAPLQMYKNVLIAFGTYVNQYSMRNHKTGTHFIEVLCNKFDEFIRNQNSVKANIMDILLETNNKLIQKTVPVKHENGSVKEEKQIAQVYSSLTAPYFFRKMIDV